MLLTLDLFDMIKPGEMFRVVTTRIQNVHQPMEAELKFVCIKDPGPNSQWTIYCHDAPSSDEFVKYHGDKVTGEKMITSICPCSPEVLKLYRF